ncbi:MAG: MarR family transcriptional regulator [Desulfobacteraceae bacterium]|nr:MarR family transcriptional regulator [Desulfobacteraceae bacterium]
MTPPDTTIEPAMDTASQLHLSALRLFRVMRAMRPAQGLGSARMSVLGRLYKGGVATATDLSNFLRIQPQSVTRLLADLERQKLITRRPNDADRRQTLIEITADGVSELTEEIRHQRLVLARAMAEALSPVEQEILRLAAILIDRLAVAAEAGIIADPEGGKQ